MQQVLIVDDERYIHHVLGKLLKEHFECEVEAVATSEEALAKMADRLPAVLFVDANMPGTNTLWLVESVRNDEKLKATPIIMLSSMSFDEIEDAYKRKGANYCFSKMCLVAPEEREQFLGTLAEFLPRKEG